MKVVFLDIDGVLVTWRAMSTRQQLGLPRPSEAFDEEAVAAFNKFIEHTGALVVVSSAWRYKETKESMQEILARNGVRCKVVGLTGIRLDGIRGLEINDWLHAHKGVTDYVVIDDDASDIVDHIPADKVIHVEAGLMSGGLTEEHFGHVAQRLRASVC